MAQNSASASLYRSYSRIDVMITAELLGAWRQTTSTKNYRAERLWPEENSRVNYPLKKALCIIKDQEIFDMEDPMVSLAVSWLTINVSKVGSKNFVNCWNHHHIPGEWWYSKSHALLSFTETTGNHSNTALLSTQVFGSNFVSNK